MHLLNSVESASQKLVGFSDAGPVNVVEDNCSSGRNKLRPLGDVCYRLSFGVRSVDMQELNGSPYALRYGSTCIKRRQLDNFDKTDHILGDNFTNKSALDGYQINSVPPIIILAIL